LSHEGVALSKSARLRDENSVLLGPMGSASRIATILRRIEPQVGRGAPWSRPKRSVTAVARREGHGGITTGDVVG